MNKDLLRRLPSVDELLKESLVKETEKYLSRTLITDLLREVLNEYRKNILADKIKDFTIEMVLESFNEKADRLSNGTLREVVNATGIIVHTNLGRSILSRDAVGAVMDICSNYNNLEYEIESGRRGSRYMHVEELIKRITGAEAALVVNNNAAAIMLTLNTLCKGKEAIVSRGQLVEIGGSFRVPDVMELSGAALVEVGTTNKTHLYDYEKAIGENTGVILKVHTSNFRIIGFTEVVNSEELVKLGRRFNIPVVEDIGSGVLVDLSKYGLTYEPTVQDSINRGIDIVTFSGDKLLGGPQCGIIAGKKCYIDAMKKNQLLRALRVDKTCLAALEATMKHYLKEEEAIENIPTLNMLTVSPQVLERRAENLRQRLMKIEGDLIFEVRRDYSMVGGGAMPGEKLESFVISVRSSRFSAAFLEKSLRGYHIPIIARISNEEVLMDLRTIKDEEFDIIFSAFERAVRQQR